MSITQDTINEGLGLIKILAGEDRKDHARIVSDLIEEIKALDKAWLNAEAKISDLEAQIERTQDKLIEEVRKNEQLKAEVTRTTALYNIAMDAIQEYDDWIKRKMYKPWWRR